MLGDLRKLHPRVLVLRYDLQHFLVERRSLRQQMMIMQILRDARELFDRLVNLAGLHVEVAEPVRGRPVVWARLQHPGVGGDRAVDPALSEQPVGVVQGSFSGHGHTFFARARSAHTPGCQPIPEPVTRCFSNILTRLVRETCWSEGS